MLQALKRFFERQMGVAPVAAGEDTQWTWHYHLGWPDWVLVLFWVAAGAFVVWVYLREGSAARSSKLFLAAMRLGLIALILLMLGELELSVDRTGLPYLVVAVDDSESQSVRDRAGPNSGDTTQSPTRFEQVGAWLKKDDGAALKELTSSQKLRFYASSTAAKRVGPDGIKPEDVKLILDELSLLKPEGRESLLGGNLRNIINDLRGTPPSAIILPTDGVTTRGETLAQVAQYAARKQIAIFPIGVGDPERPHDWELSDLLVDDTVFIGDDVTFEAKLTGRGFAGKDAVVSLKGEGIDSPMTQSVHIDSDDRPARVRFTFRPNRDRPQKKGTFTYRMEVPVAERELNVDNNRVEKPVTFIDEKIHVLLVETGPRYEFRFLKNLLDRQSTVDVQALLLDADPEYVQQDRSAIGFFPTNMEDLAKFDAIVMGDVKPSSFTFAQMENLKEFVKKGGGLAVVAGAQFTPQAWRGSPLEDLLPVRISPAAGDASAGGTQAFRPRMTLDGAASPIFRFVPDDEENKRIWNSLPPLFWFAGSEKLKPGAQALLEHPSEQREGKPMPLVATQFYGAGRTYYQGFDGSWRWRFQVEDLYHARYWIQTLRYLCRAKLLGKNRTLELNVDRTKYRRGDPVRIRAQYLIESRAPAGDEPLRITVERLTSPPTKATVELKRSPGRRDLFEGTFAQTEDGQYRARVEGGEGDEGPQQARFVVTPPPGEMDNVQLNEDELKALAKQTGGRYYPIAEADRLFADGVLPYGQRVSINTDRPYPLWRTWPMLLLFTAVLLVEWVVRKRNQMV